MLFCHSNQRVYEGYLRMYHDPSTCEKYGRAVSAVQRAQVFKISHLHQLYELSRIKADVYTLRTWTYILISIALFMRKSEAAALRIEDIDVPADTSTNSLCVSDGIPNFVYIRIERSKTDQLGQGMHIGKCILATNRRSKHCICPLIKNISYLLYTLTYYRSKAPFATEC